MTAKANRIEEVVGGMTDEQLRLLVEVTGHRTLIASMLHEAYKELRDRDNRTEAIRAALASRDDEAVLEILDNAGLDTHENQNGGKR